MRHIHFQFDGQLALMLVVLVLATMFVISQAG
jgi:hypothetical protein